ncbi:MAG: HD domain-containing phosphohydrolase [Bdellovibrionota bacterium]
MPQNTKLKILLVEDDLSLQKSLMLTLGRSGHAVEAAGDGKSAQDKIISKDYDLVISDIRMPNSRVSGLDLLIYIKEHKPIPVILMTGFGALSEVEAADRKGADKFLSKPFTNAELTAGIAALFYSSAPLELPADLDPLYAKLGIDDFITGRQVKFDIFVRLSSEKYILIAHQGEDISPDRILIYKTKGIKYLYLKKDDFHKYLELNLTLSIAVRGNQNIDQAKKASLLRHTGEVFLESIYREEIDREAYEMAKLVAENSVEFLSSYSETLGLLTALNEHSDALYAHSLGVSLYSVMIAQGMGWNSAVTLMRISVLGLMHDIGKKEISREILDKPENNLSASEVSLLETHSQRSAEILARTGAPEDVIQAVLQHHENCQGTGYPARHRKNKIIPTARLLYVADKFCELVIKRPGVECLVPQAAIAKIENMYGEAIDPSFLTALKMSLKFKRAETA